MKPHHARFLDRGTAWLRWWLSTMSLLRSESFKFEPPRFEPIIQQHRAKNDGGDNAQNDHGEARDKDMIRHPVVHGHEDFSCHPFLVRDSMPANA